MSQLTSRSILVFCVELTTADMTLFISFGFCFCLFFKFSLIFLPSLLSQFSFHSLKFQCLTFKLMLPLQLVVRHVSPPPVLVMFCHFVNFVLFFFVLFFCFFQVRQSGKTEGPLAAVRAGAQRQREVQGLLPVHL